MNIQPEGENLRKAVKWISAEHRDNPQISLQSLVDTASITFNLTPLEATYLDKLVREQNRQ